MEKRSDSPGMVFEYERSAMNGDPLPKNLCFMDQLMFLALRNLYASYRSGKVDRESGHDEKIRLIYRYQEANKDFESFRYNTQRMSEFFKKVEIVCSDYQKNRTLENADRIIDAIYNLERRDDHQ